MTSYNAFRDGEPLASALDEVVKLRARIERLEKALRAWESAVRVDVLMEGPRYMGVSGGAGERAWKMTRAALGEKS